MKKRIAIKRLTASDLTFFEWHFRNRNAGNQKAINLNADVFIREFYPALPELAPDKGGKIPLDLSIFGPGLLGEHNIQRKIVKQGSYKNWRLNGEFVYNPDDFPDRYNILKAGDFAILEFSGKVIPNAMKLFLIAADNSEDKVLHDALEQRLQSSKMIAIGIENFKKLANGTTTSRNHAVYDLFFEADMEDAVSGGLRGHQNIARTRKTKQISREQFQKGKEFAELLGVQGEELLDFYFCRECKNDNIKRYEWTANTNAISPYDFEYESIEGTTVILDAKSTSGEFGRVIHISMAELFKMVESEYRYDIYRIYNISENTANLRISQNMQSFAQKIITGLGSMPDGVTVDSVSIDPNILPFGDEMVLHGPEKFTDEFE